jgi:polyisoprenoid-binding protein YceI
MMIPVKANLWKFSFLTALALGSLLSSRLLAQESVLELDPAQTHIEFTLNATLHTVHGRFKLKHGVIRFDPATGKASGIVVIETTSGATGNEGRDRKMHKDVLQSAQYPEATFTPTQIKGKLDPKSDSTVAVSGIFKLHGSDHEVTLTFQVHQTDDRLNASSHLVIPYQQWGLKNPSTLFLHVSDRVDIDIQSVGRLTSPDHDH